MFNIDIDVIVIAKIMRQYNSRKISSELLFLLLVIIIVSSITLANSSASDMALEQGKHKIHSIRDSGPGDSDTGCPPRYTVTSMFEDECTGEGTPIKKCPKNFDVVGDVCVGPYMVLCDDQLKGYSNKGAPSTDTIRCVGPPIVDKYECPPGFRNDPQYPQYCVGLRKL